MNPEFIDIHPSWHEVFKWNEHVFEVARKKSEEEFDKLIAKQKPKSQPKPALDI